MIKSSLYATKMNANALSYPNKLQKKNQDSLAN